MSLRDFKIPRITFNDFKISFDNTEEELSKIDYEKLAQKPVKKRNKPYEDMNHFKTIKEAFTENVQKYPDNACILEKPDHKTDYKITTYKEFYNDVVAFGSALINICNLKDKRVMIIGETQYDWYLSYMTCLCGGILVVPTDRELPYNELENIVKRSRVSCIIYSPRKQEDIEKLKSSVEDISLFVEMKSDKPLDKKDVGIKNLVELGNNLLKSGNNNFEKIEVDPEEFKILFFTSGTTSQSKGVMLCNKNLAENLNAISAYVKIYPTDRLFSVLPLHHCYESTIGFLEPMSVGASVAICEGLRYIVPNMMEAKPTVMLAVPLLIETLYKKINEKITKSKKDVLVNTMIHMTNALKVAGIDIKKKVFKSIYDNLGGNLRIIVSAAAPIDPKVGKWLQDIGMIFLQGYGLTETAPISAVTPDYKINASAAGLPIVQSHFKILNPNENGEGEILIKTPTLMLGYYEMEEETKKVIDDEGYFHSGDIGYLDEDGFVYLTGRSKNVIVTQNGKNIYPEEIEMILEKYDEIKEVMIYGKEPEEGSKRDQKELIVTAKVVPNYDKIKELHGDMSSDEIYDLLWKYMKETNKKLTSYKAIKGLEIKETEFEKTSTMKIKRYKEQNDTK